MGEINMYQQKVNEGKLAQKMTNDANNMLEYFRKKLKLIIDMNELRNTIEEFNSEKRKYF